MRTSPLEALADIDLTWAATVMAVMLACERNVCTKHRAMEALGMTEPDFDIWRRRFVSLGREMYIRLREAAA